jgi:hypothetical protein
VFFLGLGVGVNREVALMALAMAQKTKNPQKYIFLCIPRLLDQVLLVKGGRLIL